MLSDKKSMRFEEESERRNTNIIQKDKDEAQNILLRTPAASHRRPLEVIILWNDPFELRRVGRLPAENAEKDRPGVSRIPILSSQRA